MLNKRFVLLVQHTGAGKSLAFQLPLFLDDKYNSGTVTVVVLPTISLMHDHMRELDAINKVLTANFLLEL